MNKQPTSAVQPVFAQSPWQKERLTHSQPREKPRHQKETQQSWMKHNMAAANVDSKPMSVVVDLGVNWPTCAMGTEIKILSSGCETIDDTLAENETQTAALNHGAVEQPGQQESMFRLSNDKDKH